MQFKSALDIVSATSQMPEAIRFLRLFLSLPTILKNYLTFEFRLNNCLGSNHEKNTLCSIAFFCLS